MSFQFDNTDIDYFNAKLGIDLSGYFNRYYEFMVSENQDLINFFSGISNSIKYTVLLNLNKLLDESDSINNIVANKKRKLTNLRDWECVDYLTEMRTQLKVTQNLDKFLRSSKRLSDYTSKTEFTYIRRQGDTLERIARKKLESNDFDNDWATIAQRNDLQEKDYEAQGNGESLNVEIDLNSDTYNVTSVIDVIDETTILGKDIEREISFTNDDITVLNTEETFKQSVEVLSVLGRGDIPEFPDFGMMNMVGNNLNAFGLPALIRQMVELFSTDDTIASFRMEGVEYKENSADLEIKYAVTSKLQIIEDNRKINI